MRRAKPEAPATPDYSPVSFDSGVPEEGPDRADYLSKLVQTRGIQERDIVLVVAEFNGIFVSQQLEFRGLNGSAIKFSSVRGSIVANIDLTKTTIVNISLMSDYRSGARLSQPDLDKARLPITPVDLLFGPQMHSGAAVIPPRERVTTFGIRITSPEGIVKDSYIKGAITAIHRDSVTIKVNNWFGHSLHELGLAGRVSGIVKKLRGEEITIPFTPPQSGRAGTFVTHQQSWHYMNTAWKNARPAPSSATLDKIYEWSQTLS